MSRWSMIMCCLFSTATAAQTPACMPGQPGCGTGGEPQMMHQHIVMQMASALPAANHMPTQAGQSAFAAIQEIVGILEADPNTDWSKVNIEALRQHLIDMNNVTLAAVVRGEPVAGGMSFSVTGSGVVCDSIRRMVMAHAATMEGVDNWHFEAASIDDGARLIVRVPPADLPKLEGIGFIGVLTHGMHHQMHHLMVARGGNPHQ